MEATKTIYPGTMVHNALCIYIGIYVHLTSFFLLYAHYFLEHIFQWNISVASYTIIHYFGMIMKDGERYHSMGSPMDRTPPQFKDLIERLIKDNLCRYCSKTFEMAKGKKEVSGCCSLVAEHWQHQKHWVRLQAAPLFFIQPACFIWPAAWEAPTSEHI